MAGRPVNTAWTSDDSTGVPSGAEAYAHAILDAALDPFVTIDHLGHVLEFNSAAERTFGYRRADVIGRELADLVVPPERREAHRRALARWTESGPTEGAGALLGRMVEVEALRADGARFPAELTISRVDVPGPPVFTACIRDVSDRKLAEDRLRAAEARYRTLVEHLPLVSYVDAPESPVANALYISPQISELLGYAPDEWLSDPDLYVRSIHEDDREAVIAARHAAYESGEELRIEYRMLTSTGKTLWVEDRSVLVQPPDGGLPFRHGFALDITERRAAEAALRRAEARFRTLVEQLPVGVYVDKVDEWSSNLYTSPQIEQMLGYSAEEWVSSKRLFTELVHPHDRERVQAAHKRAHASGDGLALEYRLRAKDGRTVWVLDEARVVADVDTGQPVLQGCLLDITARKEAEEQLRHQAFHDPLTGLANTQLFADRVEHALVVGTPASVVFLDLDDFKAVNDSLGHRAGNQLLQVVASRLAQGLRPSDTIARLGGDEFGILVEHAAADEAVAVAERVAALLQTPFHVDGHEVFVTASVGIGAGTDAEELLRSADVAMYRAKAAGKAQHVVYAPRMSDGLGGRLDLVAELRRACAEEQLVLHYQPVVEIASGRIRGLEALVRWQHPVRGLLAPAEFVEIAEDTGQILELGRWVLSEACRQTARWRATVAPDLTVGVNVSRRQIRHPALCKEVVGALEASGLPASALMLEVTETSLARRLDEMKAVLVELSGHGVRIAVDDFGTGYSSLSTLGDLPVDVLKIDRGFVGRLGSESGGDALVRAICQLGDALGLAVVGEGVETAVQAAALARQGCALAQGFYYARPADAGEITKLLAAGGFTPRPRLAAA